MHEEPVDRVPVAFADAWLEMTLEDWSAQGDLAPRRAHRRKRAGREVFVGASVVLLGVLGVAFAMWQGGREPAGVPDPLGARPAAPDTPARDAANTEPPQPRPRLAPIEVLLLEDTPGFEFRHAMNVLLRDDTVRLQTFLLDAPPDFEQPHSQGLPALRALPAPAELARYRVILLGDVAPNAIARGGVAPAAFATAVAEFVARGGGLAVRAGGLGMPARWRDTMLAAVLPVAHIGAPDIGMSATEHPLAVTPAGARHPVLRGGGGAFDGAFDSGRLAAIPWQRLAVRFHFPISARGDAEVLLESADDTRLPALIAGTSGRGRVLFAAIDEFWRLRAENGDAHARFYRQAIAWLVGD